ncbi:hypothetical protein E2562_021874 [Oryza meyeriana var. granulata]|uniref:Uncharacterized protein n=1 Tax=Oryza meyeriana var. granulata TaxID=110450 RepID=A0A6G1C810_9ORYZ|nr:hypothetical protein E2562_021874 [Oryza meyeriana var. granulata]
MAAPLAEPINSEFLQDPGSPPTPAAPGTPAGDRTPFPAPIELMSPPSGEQDLDDDHDDALLCFRRINNIQGDVAVPREA